MTAALDVLLALAALAAVALARRVPSHRPVAALLAWGLASDLAQPALRLAYDPHRVDGLVAGPWRALHALGVALHLSWPAALVTAAAWCLLGRRWAVPALGALLACSAAVVLRYSDQPAGVADPLYTWIAIGEAVLLVGILAAWAKSAAWPLSVAAKVLLVLALAEVALLAGPYLRAEPARDWALAAPARALAWILCAVLQWSAWRRLRSGSSPPS